MRRKGYLPDDIAGAAVDFQALSSWANSLASIAGCESTRACVAIPRHVDEPACVWVDPRYQRYRAAWLLAQQQHLVEPISGIGEWVDVDHVVARSWAIKAGFGWVRLFPVWAEVNRSAGGGRERTALQSGNPRQGLARRGGLIFAGELQLMKMMGHPVGTTAQPESL